MKKIVILIFSIFVMFIFFKLTYKTIDVIVENETIEEFDKFVIEKAKESVIVKFT